MKFLLVACLVAIALATSLQENSKLVSIVDECRKITGAEMENIRKMKNGEELDDHKVYENYLCVLKKIGLANEEGDILKEKFVDRAKLATEEDKAQQVVKDCFVQYDCKAKTAFKFTTCVHKNIKAFSPVD